MVLTIEEGKFYRTRDGRLVGPMIRSNVGKWTDIANGFQWSYDNGMHCHKDVGCPYDLVSEVPNSGPVRTVTRKEIVPGEYGIVRVLAKPEDDPFVHAAHVRIDDGYSTSSELRAAAATLIEIADALGDTK